MKQQQTLFKTIVGLEKGDKSNFYVKYKQQKSFYFDIAIEGPITYILGNVLDLIVITAETL